jgi:hypothetical protein
MALRPEVTQPSPLGSSELAGASMVQSGVWRVPTLWKMGLRPEDNVPQGTSSRVQLVVRRVLEVQLTTVGPEGCLWAHSGCRHWWPYPLSLLSHSNITHSLQGAGKNPSTLLPGLAPQLADYPHSLGLCSPYHHLAACTRPQERGAAVSLSLISAPRVHIWASPITTPPQWPSYSNTNHFYQGHN